MLKDKTILITGAARGLGESMAVEAAAFGARVAIVDILDDLGEAVAARIRQDGGSAEYFHCDIVDEGEVEQAVIKAEDLLGPLDGLVNNAAIALPATPITELDLGDFTRLMDVNVGGAFRFCKAVFPRFVQRGGGAVVNLSSVHQSHSLPGWSSYAASKGAIISATRQLAAEWGVHNIRVNSVSPGAIDATMTREILDADETGELERRFQHMHALERMGKSEEVGKTVAFLLSDGAAFITGEDILVDGGLTKVIRQ